MYLPDISCGVCFESKFKLIFDKEDGIDPSELKIFITNPNIRQQSLFAARNSIYVDNIFTIDKTNINFPIDRMGAVLFTISVDNKMQNLKSFEQIVVDDIHLYIKSIRKNL